MKHFKLFFAFFFFYSSLIWGQNKTQDYTAAYIKSASFMKQQQAVVPFFRLSEGFVFEFDDLLANEANYYYRMIPYNYDWTPSKLRTTDYLNGMENQRIQEYENSFNTLQSYSHYKLSIPNRHYKLLKSGNYILEIYDDSDDVIIRRKLILYEHAVNVSAQVKRSRDVSTIDQKQNLEFTIHLGDQTFQNPVSNIKVALFQNGRWDSYITEIAPQYTIGTDLIYKYNKETQFWGGNEYLNFDNSDIRSVNNMIGQVSADTGVYSSYLYTNDPRAHRPYTYFPDINGSYRPRILNRDNASIEADYSWVYFRMRPLQKDSSIRYFVTGLFNNYELNQESLMEYNAELGVYEKAILVKQGFTNFGYTAVKNNKVDPSLSPDGNFAVTENQYHILIYYRGNTDLYDRVIGIGETNSEKIEL